MSNGSATASTCPLALRPSISVGGIRVGESVTAKARYPPFGAAVGSQPARGPGAQIWTFCSLGGRIRYGNGGGGPCQGRSSNVPGWSPEAVGAEWLTGESGTIGSTFRGQPSPLGAGSTICTVDPAPYHHPPVSRQYS